MVVAKSGDILINNGVIYEIGGYEETEEMQLKQILSTFRFVK
jgi:hypothetical protein